MFFRVARRRLFDSETGNLIVDSVSNGELTSSTDQSCFSMDCICDSFDVPLTLVGRFLRSEEARTLISCNISTHKLKTLWTAFINILSKLSQLTSCVQENSNISTSMKQYPTDAAVFISPIISLVKSLAKQQFKQVMELVQQIDQALDRLLEDKKALVNFSETNHFLISQLVRYCVELERESSKCNGQSNNNSNMKTKLIKEREFVSHFQRLFIRRLGFILDGLNTSKLENLTEAIEDFQCTFKDIAKQYNIHITDDHPEEVNVAEQQENQPVVSIQHNSFPHTPEKEDESEIKTQTIQPYSSRLGSEPIFTFGNPTLSLPTDPSQVIVSNMETPPKSTPSRKSDKRPYSPGFDSDEDVCLSKPANLASHQNFDDFFDDHEREDVLSPNLKKQKMSPISESSNKSQ